MPSPFPGMDPYLEGHFWRSFSLDLVVEIKRLLVDALRPYYYPLIGHYDVVTVDTNFRYVVEPDLIGNEDNFYSTPIYMNVARPQRVGLAFIKIIRVEDREPQTVIDLLDPITKKQPGRKHHLRWREKILSQPVHLVELDLLRIGARLPMVDAYPEAAYYALLCRSKQRPVCEVWPIQLEQSLPTIPVPVAKDMTDIPLNLQQAFSNAFDHGYFRKIVNYKEPPDVPLTEAQTQWARRTIAADQAC